MTTASLTRLLIANRGEIACRIARTARRLGWTAIAVYSDADRGAKHVREADEAYHLGGSAAAQSYLNVHELVELARRVGAHAVHPGYGFLSENADFAQACIEAGLKFVGPPPAAIRAMGSKSASKAAMAAAGVPVAPGYHGAEQSAERLAAEAERVGFPLIIKASAGGGGKGMQVVSSAHDVAGAVASARRLARTAFGDDRLLLERYFPTARHVEVQIFADDHGALRVLHDRDCSVQRRHQKIIEEAPAPGLEPRVKEAMAQAAMTAARAVGYVGAGTVEFLVDAAQNFYFMEMNTRLQVEHPVTEMITGIDLVEWQLRVARGEPLPASPHPGVPRGAAIEARLYAEDPAQEYLPSVGRIEHLEWPALGAGLRLDTGVDAGDEVSAYYDPMLGKIIAWGATRDQACALLLQALDRLEIAGVATNRALLSSILADEEFRRGAVDTHFLTARRAHLRFGERAAGVADYLLAALWQASAAASPAALWSNSTGWRLGAAAVSRWQFGATEVRIEALAPRRYRGFVGDSAAAVLEMVHRSGARLEADIDGRIERANVVVCDGRLELFRADGHVTLRAARTEDALRAAAAPADAGSLVTPLPGTVVTVHVSVGQAVPQGAPLITIEAMKMEHTVTAPQAGTVQRLPFAPGERVAAGCVLVDLCSHATPSPLGCAAT